MAWIQMNIISKREFDERVSELYTPNPDDTQLQIDKYSYEAYIDSIEDLILESLENPTTISDIDEPVYLSVIGTEDLDDKIKNARDLNTRGLLYGLLFINVNIDMVQVYLSERFYSDLWNITELHVFSSSPRRSLMEDTSIFNYLILNQQRFIRTMRPDRGSSNINPDTISHIGLHGHSVDLWNYLELSRLQSEELSMRSLGTIDRLSDIDLRVVIDYPIRIVDVELTDDLVDSDIRGTNNIPEWPYESTNREIPSNLQYYSAVYKMQPVSYLTYIILRGSQLNTFKILGNIPPIELNSMTTDDVNIDPMILELDLIYTNPIRTLPSLSRFRNLEILKMYYSRYNILGRLPGPWNRIPNLTIVHLFGGIDKYRDNFDQMKNVIELKISLSDPTMVTSIYNMPSLETLILTDVNIDHLDQIDPELFLTRPNIIIESMKNYNVNDILNYLAENEENLSDHIILLLTELMARL